MNTAAQKEGYFCSLQSLSGGVTTVVLTGPDICVQNRSHIANLGKSNENFADNISSIF